MQAAVAPRQQKILFWLGGQGNC